MPAPSKAFTAIADTSIDPDSPLDTSLFTALRDNDVHLEEWLGHGYTAAQNHNHDGVNSALVEIGPNPLRNGSFESDGDGWTVSTYTGGSVAYNTANDMDGAKALAFTSTSTVNGGGKATSGEFRTCTGGFVIGFRASVKASVANVSSRARAIWYDDAQAQISTSDIFSYTNTPTVATKVDTPLTAPSNARFYKVELEGGVPGSGSATGTVYFDGVRSETGVMSLNGQTGQVVDTDLYAIGSYVTGRPNNGTDYTVNSTIAGTSLYTTTPFAYWDTGISNWASQVSPSGSATHATLVNTGSWRCVSPARSISSQGCPGLWVRYA